MQFSPFRVFQYVQGELVMTLNDGDTLYFENSTGLNADVCGSAPNSYAENIDYQMAVGLGASFESEYLYGLAERES